MSIYSSFRYKLRLFTPRKIATSLRLFFLDPQQFKKKMRKSFGKIPFGYHEKLNMKLYEWLLYQQKKIFDQNKELWSQENEETCATKCSWMGYPLLKNPLDSWIYQEMIFEVKPDIIVEIGSYEGGSTMYFAHLLDIIGHGNVVSVEIDRSKYLAKHPRIIDITGDSTSEDVINKTKEICKGKKVLMIHDGCHRKSYVLKDLKNYCSIIPKDSYIIVEDSIIDIFRPGDGLGKDSDGPLIAVKEFLKENKDFIIDKSKERYILTSNPNGFLKRVK